MFVKLLYIRKTDWTFLCIARLTSRTSSFCGLTSTVGSGLVCDMAVHMDTLDPPPACFCLGAVGPWAIEAEGPRLSPSPELTD